MKKVIFSLAVIVLSAGAVVATTTSSAKAKSACTSCTTCHCPVCGSDCGMSCKK